jgi:hypothetical protein
MKMKSYLGEILTSAWYRPAAQAVTYMLAYVHLGSRYKNGIKEPIGRIASAAIPDYKKYELTKEQFEELKQQKEEEAIKILEKERDWYELFSPYEERAEEI